MSYGNGENSLLSSSISQLINSPITPAGYSFGLKSKKSTVGENPVKVENTQIKHKYGELITPINSLSKTVLEEDDFYKRVNELELQIHNRPNENILAIDECGNVTMHVIGEESRVTMERIYWDNAKVVIHNHPNGATLSGADVSCLFETECGEIRACSFNTWYSLKRTEETKERDAEDVREELTETLTNCILDAAEDACENNDIELDIQTKAKTIQPIRGSRMSEKEFAESAVQAEKEFRILAIIFTHLAVEEFAWENNLIYTVGELKNEE